MSFFMQIQGISGSATERNHQNWIVLNSIDFGVHRQITTKAGHSSNRESSAPKIGEVTVTKSIDKSSPQLLEASCVGASNGTVVIHGTHTNTGNYVEYTLSDVIISHYDATGVAGESDKDEILETIGLNFTKIEMKFIPKGADNRPQSPISAGYDLTKATKI